ncbi:MAG TPA: TonB-dependent receptor, partial [Ramlibacter sp.]|nr:TonB-dependent receptor [Ramlibacter sp.]
AIRIPDAVGEVITLPPIPDNKTNLAGEWQRYDAEATNVLLRGDLALGDNWSLTLEGGRAETVRDRNFSDLRDYNLTTGEGDLEIFFGRGQRYVNNNYRAELLGRLGTGWVQHEVTVGYTHNERNSFSGESAPTARVPQNLFNPRPVPRLDPPLATPGSDSTITDKGLYVLDRVLLGERWQVLAGLRAADYSNVNVSSSYSASKVSPNLSVMFKPAPDTSIYASYLEGLEETGFASASHANVGEVLPPAVNKQLELGVKTRAFAGVFAQAAVFQIERPQTTTTADNRFVIGGESRYRGLELSLAGDLSPRWGIVSSMQLLDAEIVSVGASNAGELGKTPENTPRRTFSLFGEYRVPQLAGLSVNAGLYYVGERAVNNLNQAWAGSYTTVSLGARYRTRVAGQNVVLQANLDNAADRDYWATAGNGYLGTGAPRTLRLAAKVDF